MDDILL